MGDRVQLPLWPGLSAKPDKHVGRREHKQRAAPRAAGKRPSSGESPQERAVRERLQTRMSARVALKHNKGRGSFTVYFGSYDQLDEIMRRIHA